MGAWLPGAEREILSNPCRPRIWYIFRPSANNQSCDYRLSYFEIGGGKRVYQHLPGRTVIIDSSEMQEPTRLDEVTAFSGALVQCFEFSGAQSFCLRRVGPPAITQRPARSASQ